jgi:hypothetical protein
MQQRHHLSLRLRCLVPWLMQLLRDAMQDVGDKAKDAANQTEGAIKDAAGAVKGKVRRAAAGSPGRDATQPGAHVCVAARAPST